MVRQSLGTLTRLLLLERRCRWRGLGFELRASGLGEGDRRRPVGSLRHLFRNIEDRVPAVGDGDQGVLGDVMQENTWVRVEPPR